MSLDVDVKPDTKPVDTDGGDHDRFSHYVRKIDREQAWLSGKPCVALCGKVWLPVRDPEKYPVCVDCKKIYESMAEGGPTA